MAKQKFSVGDYVVANKNNIRTSNNFCRRHVNIPEFDGAQQVTEIDRRKGKILYRVGTFLYGSSHLHSREYALELLMVSSSI